MFFSFLWHFLSLVLTKGISFFVTLILAKLLSPDDFGIMAISWAFISIGSLIADSGISQSLIRKKKNNDIELATAFWSSLVLGTLASIIIFYTASYVSSFYGKPILESLLKISSLNCLIVSFYTVPNSLLIREMKFKKLFSISIFAAIISGVIGGTLAYLEFGVFALVWQLLLNSIVMMLGVWLSSNYKIKIDFDRGVFKNLISFGGRLFLSGVLDVIYRNSFTLFMGRFFSGSVLGAYHFAEKWKDVVVVQLNTSLQSVSYPALSKERGNNEILLKKIRDLVVFSTFLFFPFVLFFYCVSDFLIVYFLGNKWSVAIEILNLLLLSGLLYPLHVINLNILKIVGRSDLFLKIEIFKKLFLMVSFFLLLNYGIIVVLWGQLILSVIFLIPHLSMSWKCVNYRPADQLADFLPQVSLGCLLFIPCKYLSAVMGWSRYIIISAILTLMIYFLVSFVFKMRGFDLLLSKISMRAKENV